MWAKYPLVEKHQISPNTAVYRFGLPHPQDRLGLPIGQHVSVQADIGGKMIMRSYTPTTSDDDLGHFDLLIKSYPTGNISKYFGELKIGDLVQFKGPKGQMKYSPTMALNVGMIAGGTGITPMLQIIHAICKNPLDLTKVSLIYANVAESDILLRDQLDKLAAEHPMRFKVHYVLNNPPEGWTGGVGFVSKEMIEEKLPKPAKDMKMLLCGPPPMLTAMKTHLSALGFEKANTISKMPDQVFAF